MMNVGRDNPEWDMLKTSDAPEVGSMKTVYTDDEGNETEGCEHAVYEDTDVRLLFQHQVSSMAQLVPGNTVTLTVVMRRPEVWDGIDEKWTGGKPVGSA